MTTSPDNFHPKTLVSLNGRFSETEFERRKIKKGCVKLSQIAVAQINVSSHLYLSDLVTHQTGT